MGVDMFICGSCQRVFHNIDEFVSHKNEECSPEQAASSSEADMRDDKKTSLVQDVTVALAPLIDGHQGLEIQNTELPAEIQVQSGESGLTEVITETSHQVSGQQQQQALPPSDEAFHQVVQVQEAIPTQQVVADTSQESIVLRDIIEALQQGRAITVQDSTGFPTEIQLVLPSKAEESNSEQTTVPRPEETPAEGATVHDASGPKSETAVAAQPKSGRKRGRPKKGQEVTKKPTIKVEPTPTKKPPTYEADADGKMVCTRCKKKFNRERHFHSHKCLAMSDFVEIMEKELTNNSDEEDEEVEKEKDDEFRVPFAVKRRRLSPNQGTPADANVTKGSIIKPDGDNDSTEQSSNSSQTSDKNKEEGSAESQPSDKATGGAVEGASQEELSLAKEGLADFPGAGDVKLSELRVDDGLEDAKLRDPLAASLSEPPSGRSSRATGRRGRRPVGEIALSDARPRGEIKNTPIFCSEEDKLEFEKAIDVDLSGVDSLFKIHIIDQDMNDFAAPMRNHNSDRLSVYSCNMCGKVIMNQSHARLHCLTHTDLKPYQCFKCSYATNTKGNLYSHMRIHTGQLYKCQFCSFSTINKGHLIEHEAIHSSERHDCSVCHRSYSTPKSLLGHVRRKHADSKKGKEYLTTLMSNTRNKKKGPAILHQCHICNRKFKKKLDRERHMYVHDSKDNPNSFTCDLCTRPCSRRSYLEKHLLRHRIVYFCWACDSKFASTTHLKEHVTQVHADVDQPSEETVKEMLDRCIENSIYYPEAGTTDLLEPEEDPEEELPLITGATQTESEEEDQKAGAVIENNEHSEQVSVIQVCTLDKAELLMQQESTELNEAATPTLEKSMEASETELSIQKQSSDQDETAMLMEQGLSESDKTESQQNAEANPIEPALDGDQLPNVPPTENETSSMDTAGGASDAGRETEATQPQENNEQSTHLVREDDEQEDHEPEETVEDSKDRVYNKEYFTKAGFVPLTLSIYQRIHQVFGQEECPYCGRLYFSPADYKQHLRTHTGEKPFGCNQCAYRSISKENLKRHIEKEHDRVQFVCHECGYRALNRTQLWTHVQKHKAPINFNCPLCNKEFDQAKQLKIHIQMQHPEMPVDEAKTATSAISHKSRAKLGRKLYKCNQCDRAIFKNSADLQKHIWIHEGIKPFKCPLCPHACRSRNNLASHMIRHSMDKPFLCTECGKAYKSKTALRWHIRSHKDGKFKCAKCPYEGTQLSHLKRHMETHNIIKRYMCEHCSYSANTLGYLKIHYTRNHRGQQISQNTMVTNRLPMVHATALSDTKIYRCLSCDYLFGNLSDMKRHLKLRHHIQTENMNLLDGLNTTASISIEGKAEPLVMDVSASENHDQESLENLQQNLGVVQHVMLDGDVQIVQLSDSMDTAHATVSTDNIQQPLQYSVPEPEVDEKTASAVNILQQIIDMSHQGGLASQEITVKSEDGQSFILQHEGEVVVGSGGTEESGEYVIQYVTADGQEVTMSSKDARVMAVEPEVLLSEGQQIDIKSESTIQIPQESLSMIQAETEILVQSEEGCSQIVSVPISSADFDDAALEPAEAVAPGRALETHPGILGPGQNQIGADIVVPADIVGSGQQLDVGNLVGHGQASKFACIIQPGQPGDAGVSVGQSVDAIHVVPEPHDAQDTDYSAHGHELGIIDGVTSQPNVIAVTNELVLDRVDTSHASAI